jgi:hypothetical protein
MLTTELRRAWNFHREHAGYVVGERAIGALELARDELRAKAEGLEFHWVEDETPDTSWLDQDGWEREKQDYQDGRLLILGCHVTHPALDQYAVSLWGISVYDQRDPYCRVVEAELAGEALALIDAEQAEEAGIHVDANAHYRNEGYL